MGSVNHTFSHFTVSKLVPYFIFLSFRYCPFFSNTCNLFSFLKVAHRFMYLIYLVFCVGDRMLILFEQITAKQQFTYSNVIHNIIQHFWVHPSNSKNIWYLSVNLAPRYSCRTVWMCMVQFQALFMVPILRLPANKEYCLTESGLCSACVSSIRVTMGKL